MDPDPTNDQIVAGKPRAWQFGLGKLMLITLTCAVCLGLVKWWGLSGLIVFLVLAVPLWLGRAGKPADLMVLKSLIAYFVASLLTLPFLDAIWLGEIPLLALVQLPKVAFAGWLRTKFVMATIVSFGLSRGSFSPDYSMARPYGLAIAYLIPLAILFATLWVRTKFISPYPRWFAALLILVLLDFCLTLVLADGPGFSIY